MNSFHLCHLEWDICWEVVVVVLATTLYWHYVVRHKGPNPEARLAGSKCCEHAIKHGCNIAERWSTGARPALVRHLALAPHKRLASTPAALASNKEIQGEGSGRTGRSKDWAQEGGEDNSRAK